MKRSLLLRERRQRRVVYWQRGLPTYPLNIHGMDAPNRPPEVSLDQFNAMIAHEVERSSNTVYKFWQGTREIVGDIMEYQFRVMFPLPVHLPRQAMKTIFLLLAEDDAEWLKPEEGWWASPIEVTTFRWPKPFRWPLQSD